MFWKGTSHHYKLEATNVSVSTTVPPLIVLLLLPQLLLFWTTNQGQTTMPCSDAYRLGYDPVALREQDAQQKLKMKCHAESKGAIRECDIQV